MAHAPAGSGPRRRAVLAAALAPLAVAGCTTRSAHPAPGPEALPEDALVMIIRHGEQPPPGDTGEDEDGTEHPGSLAGRGERRAEELRRLFPPAARAPLPRPAALFATGGPSAPARCKQTVEPLATALHLPVRTEFAVGAEPALAQAVLAARMPVLVCWEHPGIPRLVRALGVHQVLGVPAAWPDRHDLVWMFTRHRGRWSFRELPQHLLPGDA
ncbi:MULTISPECIES: hypothetical protein [unclassified Streptomyces]|uniref:hypothetical protein n=1 Tax=unclassified Streptomyces TaxID=2593676 RepID=UPI002E37FE54|nr:MULTISPECIES: hypothetical protein [unclassified Streptomyces]WUC63644.1 hypothetical protein OG861_05065 [Streptomyces sp. NBC_00539]